MPPPARYKLKSAHADKYPHLTDAQMQKYGPSNPDYFEIDTSSKRGGQNLPPGEATPKKLKPNAAGPSQSAQSTPEKVSSSVIEDVEMGIPGSGKGIGGSGAGNADAGMDLYETAKPFTSFGKKFSTYKKVHQFMTFAIAPSFITITSTTPAESQKWLTTALAQIPWERPSLYLNQSEFDLLPAGSHVVEVKVRITHRGTRIAFNTASTATQLATLNQVQDILVAFGLNKTGWGVNSTYSSFATTAGKTMVPTGIGNPVNDYLNNFYGFNNGSSSFTTTLPTHQIGIPFALPNYFTLCTSSAQFGGIPPIRENMTMHDGKTTINKVVGEFNYKPKFGLLKAPLKHLRIGLPRLATGLPNLEVDINGNMTQVNTVSIQGTTPNTGMTQTNVNGTTTANNTFSSYTVADYIEKSQNIKQGQWGQYHGAQIQPSLHIGVQAIPALTNTGILSQIQAWTDAQADWDVECEMIVEEYLPTKLPFAAIPNIPAGDVIFNTGGTADERTCTFAGLYTANSILTAN